MMLYLLHFSPPYKHAKHYLGYCNDDDDDALYLRICRHVRGHGSPLVRAALAAGCEVTVSLILEGDRFDERELKRQKNGPRLCPLCSRLLKCKR